MSKATQPQISGVTRGNDMATLDEQIKLEYRMVQGGIIRYNKTLDDLLDKDLGSKTKHGRTIIKGVVEPVADAIQKALEEKTSNRAHFPKLTKGCEPNKMAYLALVSLVDHMVVKTTLMKVAKLIGIQVETQLRLDKWLAIDKEVATNVIKLAQQKSDKGFDHKRYGLDHKIAADGLDIPHWSDEQRIHIGTKLIDIIIKHTGIVKLEKKQTKKKTIYLVVPTKETEEWVDAFNKTNEVALPRYSPCVVEPKDWDGFWGGGYHSKHVNQLPFVRVHT
jgi:DNA-directed RNA polymerase